MQGWATEWARGTWRTTKYLQLQQKPTLLAFPFLQYLINPAHAYPPPITTLARTKAFSYSLLFLLKESEGIHLSPTCQASCRKHLSPSKKSHTCALLSLIEATDLADALDPLIHVLLCLGHQVKGALTGLDVKYETILQLLLVEGQACIHLLTEVQVDDTKGLLGVIILVVFQNIWVTAHPATPQDKPAFLPGLNRKESEEGETVIRWFEASHWSSVSPGSRRGLLLLQAEQAFVSCLYCSRVSKTGEGFRMQVHAAFHYGTRSYHYKMRYGISTFWSGS